MAFTKRNALGEIRVLDSQLENDGAHSLGMPAAVAGSERIFYWLDFDFSCRIDAHGASPFRHHVMGVCQEVKAGFALDRPPAVTVAMRNLADIGIAATNQFGELCRR